MTATLALLLDTFREASARRIFWGLFGLSTLMILFFLFLLNIDLVEGAMATVKLMGQTVEHVGDIERWVRGAYGGVAAFLYIWSMSLAVFASAGLTSSLLEPGRIELLLSKPVSRLHILLARYAGNVLVVSLNVVYLVLGVWLILGFKTGIWDASFLYAIPATIFTFAVLLTMIVLIGVAFESAALGCMVTMTIMIMSAILAQTSLMLRLLSSEWSRDVWRTLYYAFPKVFDIGNMMLQLIRRNPPGDVFMPLWTSALFGAIVLGAAVWLFRKRDF